MDVHPTKNGIYRYWPIPILHHIAPMTWETHGNWEALHALLLCRARHICTAHDSHCSSGSRCMVVPPTLPPCHVSAISPTLSIPKRESAIISMCRCYMMLWHVMTYSSSFIWANVQMACWPTAGSKDQTTIAQHIQAQEYSRLSVGKNLQGRQISQSSPRSPQGHRGFPSIFRAPFAPQGQSHFRGQRQL